jgi:hypothetical protein
MSNSHAAAGPSRSKRRWVRAGLTACGALAAVVLLGGFGEAYLRFFPPRDSHIYLGEASPLHGPFVPDADIGVAYRSWQAFRDDNPCLETDLLSDRTADSRPVWAFFGNSFVQAPGMLADTARARVPERHVLNVGRNEHLCVRLAQVRLLLDQGLKPERVFVAFMPLDASALGKDPLASLHVTARGALTYQTRLPDGPLSPFVECCALARTAWFRTGRHHTHPDFRAGQLNQGVNDDLRTDLDHLFGWLARTAVEHHVPVTVLLIPNHEQITRGAAFAFQDELASLLRRHDIDVCDPRDAFLSCPDKPALFIPDKHFSDAGNRILLDELLRHLHLAGVAVPRVDPL